MGLFINTQDLPMSEDVCCLGVSPYLMDILSEEISSLQELSKLFQETMIAFHNVMLLDESVMDAIKSGLSKAKDKLVYFLFKIIDGITEGIRRVIAFFRKRFKSKETEMTEAEAALKKTREENLANARELFHKQGFIVFTVGAEVPANIVAIFNQITTIISQAMDTLQKENKLNVDELSAKLDPLRVSLLSIKHGKPEAVRTNITLKKFESELVRCIEAMKNARRTLTKYKSNFQDTEASANEFTKFTTLMMEVHKAMSYGRDCILKVEHTSLQKQRDEFYNDDTASGS